MTTSTCGLPREWLLALRDGDLRGAQLEVAEAHVRACPTCRRWMIAMDEVDRLLRDATPYRDDPLARARIKARVAEGVEPPGLMRSASLRAPWARTLAASALLALALFMLPVWGAALIDTSSGIAGWLRTELAPSSAANPSARDTPVVAPTLPDSVPLLPLGLVPVGTPVAGDAVIEQFYRAPDGLALVYISDCSGTASISLPLDANLAAIASVAGTPVMVQYGPGRDHVIALFWAGDTRSSAVLVQAQPAGLLDDAAALKIAAALMAAEDLDGAPCAR